MYIPQAISALCSVFIRQGGCIYCMVTGRQRCSVDILHSGGMEVLCTLCFVENKKDVKNLVSTVGSNFNLNSGNNTSYLM